MSMVRAAVLFLVVGFALAIGWKLAGRVPL